MTDSHIPHKGHDVVQWSHDPVAGYPYTRYYCFDCGESTRIVSGVSL